MKTINSEIVMKTWILLLCLFVLRPDVVGQKVNTYKFADRDTSSLRMDVYQPEDTVRKDICVVYIFGGGFVRGSRTDSLNIRFFKDLVVRGYTVAAIDYRLGLKDAKIGFFHLEPLFEAPVVATEDLVSATEFILNNQKVLRIDPRRIVLVGSSAGAITALQADNELANRTAMVSGLPADFRYAAVVSLAGGIISTKGRPKYNSQPAPTLFYHGTKDKIVAYNKLSFFKKGIYGTKSLVKTFEKKRYPFMVVRYKDMKHKVATFTRFEAQDQICDFIDMAVKGDYRNELDITIYDKELLHKYR